MVTGSQTQVNNEPHPEFNDRCMTVIRSWERGELPFKEAIARLTIYSQEAVADGTLSIRRGRAVAGLRPALSRQPDYQHPALGTLAGAVPASR